MPNKLVEKRNKTDKISIKLCNNLHNFGWQTPIGVFAITKMFMKLINQITVQGNTNAKVEKKKKTKNMCSIEEKCEESL